ncbi:hypothetical protein A9P82_11705 [Arachidicoccus ginsenosidimutans]|uniref:glycosyl hydrolase family 95 catalytic domain-containing protein n=1 Tax=Arachidicoccus sp. BS20 TaxID=1850526 RepID=UPI0007F14EA8|nr:hypothetical protein [Arachidicoccus sp. BS20]ANI89893.1 hypothetical protein A9P82_11705 [Arachidicoccus sp. BS20]
MKKGMPVIIFIVCSLSVQAQSLPGYNITFASLPKRWDEALPLGNGMLGALIWQKGDALRFSIDRADLWDERQALDISKFNFKWVEQQVMKHQYDTVQQLGDVPYDAIPYPTKIPAAALEFNIASLGEVNSASVDIATATAKVIWKNGAKLDAFIHATEPFGAFRLIHVSPGILPQLLMPAYQLKKENNGNSTVNGQALVNLGYAKGMVEKDKHHITYIQPGSNGFRYEVSISWKYKNDTLEGIWSIASYQKDEKKNYVAEKICTDKLAHGYQKILPSHVQWWKNYWAKSSVEIPDTLLQKQYYSELYKFGCVARRGAPPVTLQAVWTADNGLLPPWKGDIHNDLNTQLSYWLSFAGNHLQEAASFTDWLWNVREENKKFTKQYFQTDGLNVPGVATLSGKPMGGWIQYSLSPTISAWLSQYFYWQWKYSMDKNFLMRRAYPYIHDVAAYLSEITVLKNGKRVLPLSSSPEYHDNDISAWYTQGNTNYDVALMRFAFGAAAEIAEAAGKKNETEQWKKDLSQLPPLAVDSTGLMMAPGEDRTVSHRHHSNLMAIFPLGLLNPERSSDKAVIDSSLHWLQHTGTREWCGYSFSWAACLYARAKDGENAAKELRIFASNFCSPNSFHLNGDQKGGQFSGFTYRPFTLEGNFAFAEGVQQMLLQSYSGVTEVFPAVPDGWKNISFNNLRAEGAFLVSAKKNNGVVSEIKIVSEKGGTALLKLPFKIQNIEKKQGVVSTEITNGLMKIVFQKGGTIVLKND